MDTQKPEINFENIFSLLASDDLRSKEKAHELKSSFFETFARLWNDGDANLKQKMVRFAGELEVENGLRPVFLGLRDNIRTVRKEAKKSLEKLAQQVMTPTRRGKERPASLVKRSAEISFTIYKEMKESKDLDLIYFFLQTLLKIGHRGSFLAWKFFTQNFIPQNIVIEMVKKIPEPLRLNFVYQYSLDKISMRKHYGSLAKLLLKDIKDRRSVVTFLADLFDREPFLSPVFDDLCQKLNIQNTIGSIELKSARQKDKIKGLKVIGLLGKDSDYHLCLPLLSGAEMPSVRVACLNMLACSGAKKDPKIIETISALLDDKDENIRFRAFHALLRLQAPGLGNILANLCEHYPPMRPRLYGSLCDSEWIEINRILNTLPADQAREARRTLVHRIVRKNPEKLILFLNQYVKSPHNKVRQEAIKLLQKIDLTKRAENEAAVRDDTPEYVPLEKTHKKGFLGKITGRKRRKLLQQLASGKSLEGVTFQGEIFSDLDLSGISLRNINFDGAFFSNVNMTSAKLYSVTFKGARFEGVRMEKTSLDSVSFEDTVFKGSVFAKASFRSCNFTNAWIYESSFGSANLQGSIFINAKIKKTDFSQADLTETSLVGSDLTRVSFHYARLYLSDFSLARGRDCDFRGVDFSNVTTEQFVWGTCSSILADIEIHRLFFDNELRKSGGFDLVVLGNEMDKRREAFLEYNYRRTELALDTFHPDQGGLFELVPFLIHSNQALLPPDNPICNAPSGIFGYSFSPEALQLARKYFIIDEFLPPLQDEHHIEGLFTIGSVGTIAQSADSDLDYWVCVDDTKLGEKGIKLLSAKLRAIEDWAAMAFNTDLHFFIVDLASVREDRFGASDQESSGSAQGKILKEEFYRTMIYVAGKLPLWCILPPGLSDKDYQSLALRFHRDYLDLGNISTIPKGEYFGASIWQLFKGLKSPYKSVMKMALLEKYIQEEERHGLLCNRLKGGWLGGRSDLRYVDPYLLLFEEVLDYYQRTEQKNTERLLQVCFFLKLGIRSMTDLDSSVIGAKRQVVQGYIKNWGWSEATVQDLGHFREWPFDKIFRLSTNVNNYMIETYKKLSRSLQKTSSWETIITPQDLTILGRKMFVQFSKHPHKVEKLPLVVHGQALFQQLYFQYMKPTEGTPTWGLYHLKRTGQRGHNKGDLLKKGRIEEISIWLIHNGLYLPTTSFQLMPNPTPIALQDILDLLRKLYAVFPLHEAEKVSPKALLKKAHIRKLFITVNFNLHRELDKIYEYTTIYMTSWGEFFCRFFFDKNGIDSVEDVLRKAKEQFDLPFSSGKVEFYIPRLATKHIQLKQEKV